MEAIHVPVGNLIDFDSEPSTTESGPAAAAAAPAPTGNGLLDPLPDDDAAATPVAEESDATESADSENDTTESPTHHSWNNQRRSSSESYSSNQSTESAKDEVTAEQREFIRQYVEKVFTGR